MPNDNKALATRFFAEVCNGRSMPAADELFAANHVYHDPSSPWVGSGPEGMKQLTSAYHRAFPDAHWAIDEMWECEDTVITRWTGHGTHRGDLTGLAPTGKSVTVAGIWIHRIADARIVESWNIWDTLGMMQQLGAFPARANAA